MTNEDELDIDKELQIQIMREIEALESATDLEGTAIISKTGLRIASADTSSITADLFSASPAALISLGTNISESLNQGELKDVVVRGQKGFTIISVTQDSDFMLITNSRRGYALGYYFHKIHKAFMEMQKLLEGAKLREASYS